VRTKRRIEISLERNEFLIISRTENPLTKWCESCSGAVPMITPDQAAVMAGVSWRTISHWVESGRIHFTETPDGLLLICINSLSRSDWRSL
jgi:hypothetical protein